MKWLSMLRDKIKYRNEQVKRNQSEILTTNIVMLRRILTIGILIFLSLFFLCFVEKSFAPMKLVYGCILALFVTLRILYNFELSKKISLLGIYIMSEICFAFTIYLSVLAFPDSRATIILTVFCLAPLYILDVSWRINAFTSVNYLCHTILAFTFKPFPIAIDDSVNCLAVLFVGIFIGENIRNLKLDNFSLMKEKIKMAECDFLTGLFNRRKMFEDISVLDQKNNAVKSKGVIILDVDRFKDFNDNYGHQAGDVCLKKLGEILIRFGNENNMTMYRFGGEEFAGIDLDSGISDLAEKAEKLRQTLFEANIPYPHSEAKRVTASIGCASWGQEETDIYGLIHFADKALYCAKAEGRNKTVAYGYDLQPSDHTM